jgi:Na+-translocating ferredoxin:NAD+ oxidoreductase RnfG subunit
LFNEKSKEIASVIYTSPYCDSITGFGGNIPFAIVFDKDGRIQQLYLFENSETPSWIENLEKDGFFKTWNGLAAKEALELPVDAVSGATFSSTAVLESVKLRLSIYTSTDPSASGSNC